MLPNRLALIVVVALPLFASRALAAPPSGTGDDLVHYLDQSIDWYRRVGAMAQSPVSGEELLFRDAARHSARRALRLGFDFATAQAADLDARAATAPAATAGTDERARRLAQAAAAAQRRVADAQSRLDALDAQIRGGAATTRPTLATARAEVAAELDFANARADALRELTSFSTGMDGAAQGHLLRQVRELERSVPEVQEDGTAATTQPTAATGDANAFRPESAGIIRLGTELFSLTQRMSELTHLADQAAALSKANESIGQPLRTELTATINRGDAIATTRAATNPTAADEDALSAQRQSIEALTARFRQITEASVPLGQQRVLLSASRATLLEWRSALARQYAAALRNLLVRLVVMGAVIAVVLGISAVWKRATFRYVGDTRRRRQFLLLRRIVVGVLIGLVLAGGLVAEFGSLATFAGIITAGFAVALQGVILSAVAYFFYIGRYGVRVGDRVTVGGVTGEVVDVGLFRLYLMELGGNRLKNQPTGRIAVFANSVLFQPNGFFRQVPGADYGWHEVALTVAPNVDYRVAEQRLLGAIDEALGDYRESLDRQYTAANRGAHVPVPAPKPEGRLRLVDAGLEFIARYPVELRNAAEVDDRVARALLDTINQDPKLRLVVSGTPNIQPVT